MKDKRKKGTEGREWYMRRIYLIFDDLAIVETQVRGILRTESSEETIKAVHAELTLVRKAMQKVLIKAVST